MTTAKDVAKSTSILIVGDLFFKLISLFIILYLARYLGVVEFGKYSFVFEFLGFFGVITNLGLYSIIVRDMSRDKSIAPKIIGNTFVIRLILSIFAIILSIVVIKLMHYPTDTTTYVTIASFTLIFLSLSDLYASIFQVNLKNEYTITAKLIFRIISAMLIFGIIFFKGTLMQVIFVLVFSESIKTLICYLFSRKFVKPQYKIDFGLWKYLIKEALPLSVTSIVWIIYFRIDVLMLSFMIGDASVGLYSAAYKLAEPLSLIPLSLMFTLFPIMSASFNISNEKLLKSYRLSFKYVLIFMLAIAMGTTFIADKLILSIYDVEFTGSIKALQILIWALLLTSLNSILINLLVSMNIQKFYTLSTTLSAILNICLNIILIPTLSYNGAAIATVASNIVFFLMNFHFVSKYLKAIPLHKMALKPAIAGLVMGIYLYYFSYLSMFIIIPSAAILYLGVLSAIKTFTEEDVDIFKKITNIK